MNILHEEEFGFRYWVAEMDVSEKELMNLFRLNRWFDKHLFKEVESDCDLIAFNKDVKRVSRREEGFAFIYEHPCGRVLLCTQNIVATKSCNIGKNGVCFSREKRTENGLPYYS